MPLAVLTFIKSSFTPQVGLVIPKYTDCNVQTSKTSLTLILLIHYTFSVSQSQSTANFTCESFAKLGPSFVLSFGPYTNSKKTCTYSTISLMIFRYQGASVSNVHRCLQPPRYSTATNHHGFGRNLGSADPLHTPAAVKQLLRHRFLSAPLLRYRSNIV